MRSPGFQALTRKVVLPRSGKMKFPSLTLLYVVSGLNSDLTFGLFIFFGISITLAEYVISLSKEELKSRERHVSEVFHSVRGLDVGGIGDSLEDGFGGNDTGGSDGM